MNYTDHYIEIPNLADETIRLRYWDEGAGDPLILLHGIGASAEHWHKNIENLTNNYRVIVPDMPGHGKSSRVNDANFYNLENICLTFSKFVEALELDEPFHLAGNSVGGTVVINYALQHQQNLKSLCLVSPAGFGKEIGFMYRLSTLPFIGEMAFNSITRQGIHTFFAFLVYDMSNVDEELIERTYTYLKIPDTGTGMLGGIRSAATIRGLVSPYPAELLAQVQCPTLIAWGKHDPVVPVSQAQYGLAHIPNASLVIFDQAKHASQIDCAAEFNAIYSTFLSDPLAYVTRNNAPIMSV